MISLMKCEVCGVNLKRVLVIRLDSMYWAKVG